MYMILTNLFLLSLLIKHFKFHCLDSDLNPASAYQINQTIAMYLTLRTRNLSIFILDAKDESSYLKSWKLKRPCRRSLLQLYHIWDNQLLVTCQPNPTMYIIQLSGLTIKAIRYPHGHTGVDKLVDRIRNDTGTCEQPCVSSFVLDDTVLCVTESGLQPLYSNSTQSGLEGRIHLTNNIVHMFRTKICDNSSYKHFKDPASNTTGTSPRAIVECRSSLWMVIALVELVVIVFVGGVIFWIAAKPKVDKYLHNGPRSKTDQPVAKRPEIREVKKGNTAKSINKEQSLSLPYQLNEDLTVKSVIKSRVDKNDDVEMDTEQIHDKTNDVTSRTNTHTNTNRMLPTVSEITTTWRLGEGMRV